MAFNLLSTVVLVLVSLSLISGYSHPTRDDLLKQGDDESYSMPTNEQGLSMMDVEDVTKARSLQALVAGSKVIVNKAVSQSTSTKSSKKKKHKSRVGSLDVSALVGIIIASIVVTIVIICVIYLLYSKHNTEKAQSIGQEKTNGSSENQISKTQDLV